MNFFLQIWAGGNDVEELVKGIHLGVASLHVHHDYNNRNDENYDNDIALIKLQNRFTFDQSIMPICLPPEGATYAAGDMG